MRLALQVDHVVASAPPGLRERDRLQRQHQPVGVRLQQRGEPHRSRCSHGVPQRPKAFKTELMSSRPCVPLLSPKSTCLRSPHPVALMMRMAACKLQAKSDGLRGFAQGAGGASPGLAVFYLPAVGDHVLRFRGRRVWVNRSRQTGAPCRRCSTVLGFASFLHWHLATIQPPGPCC